MAVTDIQRTYTQELLLDILPRVGACMSICCAIYIIKTVIASRYYQRRIYHRIMFAASCNIILHNCVQIWGQSAFPKIDYITGETSTVQAARGNITTCTIQGFCKQFLSYAVPLYYVSLSLLSIIALYFRYNIQSYIWIEKYIHISVYGFSFGSAIYLLTKQAFNPVSRTCHVASIPIGCGDPNNLDPITGKIIQCIRGPQNIKQLQNILVVIPFLFILLFPAFIMCCMILQLKFGYYGTRGKNIITSIAKQSIIYLGMLYFMNFFVVVDAAIIHRINKYIFSTNLLSNTFDSLMGVWILLSYLYFKSDDYDGIKTSDNNINEGEEQDGGGRMRGSGVTMPNSIAETISEEIKATTTSSSRYFRPEFSIFDGSKQFHANTARTGAGTSSTDGDNNVNNNDGQNSTSSAAANQSPWAAFLIDDYEDEDYAENCEYDDTEFFGMSEGIAVVNNVNNVPDVEGDVGGDRKEEER